MVITRIEVKTVIGMYRLGFLDSSARAPEFSQPTKPETARAKVNPTSPLKPPGEPPEAWNGAPRCPCASTRTTQGENEQAQCFAAEHDERGPRRDHDAAQQDRHDERHPDQRHREPSGVSPDRKSTRLNSSHLVISY